MELFMLLLNSEAYLTLTLGILLLVKCLLFIKSKTSSWKWIHFVYFDQNHISSSSSVKTQMAKKIQNHLSHLIIITALLQVSAAFLEKILLPVLN